MKKLELILLLFGASAVHPVLHAQMLQAIVGASSSVVSEVRECTLTQTTGQTAACSLTPVAANDLIVGCVGWNDPSPSAGYATSVSGVSDGTSSFTLGTQTATTTTTPDRGQCFYLLAANSGSRTYTITFTNTNAVYTSLNTQLVFTEFSASGKTWHYDAANQNNSGSTTSTAWNSGTITTQTTYPGEAVVAFSRLFNVGATLSNILIGSYTPIEYQTATYLLNLPLAAAGGTATYSASTNWVGMITAFYAR